MLFRRAVDLLSFVAILSFLAFKMYQLLEAFMDPKMYLVFFINIALNIPNGGVLT